MASLDEIVAGFGHGVDAPLIGLELGVEILMLLRLALEAENRRKTS